MNYFDINKARDVYNSGGNVTDFLKKELNEENNTSEIIEAAYDLQSGSYIDIVMKNRDFISLYINEMRSLLFPYIKSSDNLLDVGTGELTTLSLLFEDSNIYPKEIYACDISWSRLYKGMNFWNSIINKKNIHINPFVSDIKKLPLITKSVDVLISSHALEPNGGYLPELLKELFRVCKKTLLLFEPSYELNTIEGRERMDKLGYIKGLEKESKKLGAKIIDVHLMNNISNPLNPTACYIIEPPQQKGTKSKSIFSVPGTDFQLANRSNFLVSPDVGVVFPILENIPILKENASILATGLFS